VVRVQALHIAIPVVDLAATTRFYTSVFGLVVHSASDEEGLYQLGFRDHRISLRRVATDSVSLQRDADIGIRSRHFGFEVPSEEEVDSSRAQILAHGGRVVSGPIDREDGRALFCVDPSGNQVEVYWLRPGWR
jgi:catechol-2,3-dioxygenase